MLGIGMGGFVDGILLHQIFQLHAMLSAKLPLADMENMRTNMRADGLFHAGLWLAVLAGIVLLFRAGARSDTFWSGRALVGSMLAGWGIFNLVEGIVDHHILHVHHVVEHLGPSIWDWVFLALSAMLVVLGRAVAKDRRAAG